MWFAFCGNGVILHYNTLTDTYYLIILEKKMFRLTTHNRSRISNRLAFFAALILVITAVAGTYDPGQTNLDAPGQLATNTSRQMDQTAAESPVANTAQGSKGFKMSLFLFRGN